MTSQELRFDFHFADIFKIVTHEFGEILRDAKCGGLVSQLRSAATWPYRA